MNTFDSSKEPITLRVCYFGTYRANYSRNQMMIAGLRMNGVEVIECHETLWHGIEDRVNATTGGWLRPAFWKRLIQTYLRLLKRYHHVGNYDILIIGYPGQFDVFLGRLLSWVRGKPLVWDVFMSIFLIALERGLHEHGNIAVKALKAVEWVGLRLPNLLIQDTTEYVAWFELVYGLGSDKFQLVPTGADDRIFQPLPTKDKPITQFQVLYYGTFIPNHGVEHIIEAANLLKDDSEIQFELVGTGPEQTQARDQAQAYNLSNIKFIEWLEKPALLQKVAQSDVCLGAFGITPQSLMTIQNKVYEGLAMRRPVITGDSPAIRRIFKPGTHLLVCDRANGSALASTIRTLKNDPELREHLSINGCNLFREQFDIKHNGQMYRQHLMEILGQH